MKRVLIAAAASVAMAGALPLAPANAAGCMKGAVVGGVAGHYMGHHGWLGAAAGCLIGRHRANNAAHPRPMQNNYTTANSYRYR
jgi:uncharacterized protein YcfJ